MKKIIVNVDDSAVSKLFRFLDIIDGVDTYSRPLELTEVKTIENDEQNIQTQIVAAKKLCEAYYNLLCNFLSEDEIRKHIATNYV